MNLYTMRLQGKQVRKRIFREPTSWVVVQGEVAEKKEEVPEASEMEE
jgi:hypothetical protein